MNIYSLFAVLGGLGLFFLGMKYMGDGLELAAGSKLRRMLEKITSNKYLGMLVGLVVTAIIQSSSATAAMVVGFTNAGLMELFQTVGILFGSKIGTCMTSVLLAFDMGSIVPLFIFFGVIIIMFAKKNNYKYYGQIIAGFGILFYGMTVMSGGLKQLNETGLIDKILMSIDSPWLGLLFGTVITAIIQSSSASVGILMALGLAGAINLNQAIFIVYGMNIGACMPAFLSAVGAKRSAKQVAVLNFIITLFGAILLVPVTILLPIDEVIIKMFPTAVDAQISAAHIWFNVVNMIVLMPFSNFMIKLTQRILPINDDGEEKDKMEPEFIDSRILNTPPMAVLQLTREVERLSNLAKKNYNRALKAFFEKDEKSIEKVLEREEVIDFLSKCITDYIIKINGLDVEDHDRQVVAAMYSAIQDLERIGDHAVNITEYSRTVIDSKLEFTQAALNELHNICDLSVELIDKSFDFFNSQSTDPEMIEKIIKIEDMVDDCKDMYKVSHIKRINTGECDGEAGTVFLNMLIDIERVGDHSVNVAFAIPAKNRHILT